jgi:autotransporter-associated beta strand protein
MKNQPPLPLIALLASLLVQPVAAQNAWNGGGSTDFWSSAANWTNGAPSGSAGAVTFGGSTRTTNTNNISGLTFTSLTFSNSNWSLSGNAFTLTGGITAAAGRTVSIANDILMSNGANVTLQTQNAADSKLVISGNFSAAGRIISKDGGGVTNNASTSDLIFDGNGKTVSIGEFRHRKGGVIFENGVSVTISTNQLGNDATFVGIDPFQTIRGASTVVSNTSIEIGRQANAARLTLEDGTFNAGTLLTGQNAGALIGSGFYQSGGTANIVNMRLANNGSSTVVISGGTLNLTGATTATNSSAFKLVENGTSVMTISGGEVMMGSGGGSIFQLATGVGNGTLNLDGGTLTTSGFYKNITNGTTVINLNGGTLKAGSSTTGFFNANVNTTVNVGNGGAIIDTAGFNVAVKADLLAAGNGGLTKQGIGRLTLEGGNTYTGATRVEVGTLLLNTNGVIASSLIEVAAGASFTNNSGTTLAKSFGLSEGASLGGTSGFSANSLNVAADLADGFATINLGTFAKANTLTFTLTGVSTGLYEELFVGSFTGGFDSVFVGASELVFQGAGIFSGAGPSGFEYVYDDNLNSLNVVPEPRAAALVGVGLLFFLARSFVLRRRVKS